MASDKTPGIPRSGSQFTISAGDYSAVITSVGGALRQLRYIGRDLVYPFAADDVRPHNSGAVLAPWPNRIADGRYTFQGQTYQLPLNEPARGNALHGLVLWQEWDRVSHSSDVLTLTTSIAASEGYPFSIELFVTYVLSAQSGLTWTIQARNVGATAAPYGTGPHPYLVAGTGPIDSWRVSAPGSRVLQTTEHRLLPTELLDVAEADGGRFDLRHGALLGDREIDHAFTGIPDARAEVQVLDAVGNGAVMHWDAEELPWYQIFTSDAVMPEMYRSAIAVEPMTCPPDAFNSGVDLITLAPGDAHQAHWTIAAVSAGEE